MNDLLAKDAAYLWHPYARVPADPRPLPVVSAQGVRLQLADGRELIDGVSSWWSAIHGYNHPRLNLAIEHQLAHMAHVMFAGITHQPAVELAELLADITPGDLETVFFSDSGSVAVEVALKMALQYQQANGRKDRCKFLALRGSYHGDTLGAMSVSDPGGMHQSYSGAIQKNFFADRPIARFGEHAVPTEIEALGELIAQHQQEIAAFILEPIAQCAGGMHFYSADFVKAARSLCDQHDILLIHDEVATGFGRTGKLFASEWTGVTPDILCVGKALTGGYLGLAASLVRRDVVERISSQGAFQHGPTFMANPLACAVALESTRMLLELDWLKAIQTIEQGLRDGLMPCRESPKVADVRVLGAIGVVDLHETANRNALLRHFISQGVWIRPFANLIYLMPPFSIQPNELAELCAAIRTAIERP